MQEILKKYIWIAIIVAVSAENQCIVSLGLDFLIKILRREVKTSYIHTYNTYNHENKKHRRTVSGCRNR